VLPFGLWRQWFANIWQATNFQAQFCSGETFASGAILLLRQILRLVAKAVGVIAVIAE
jgi:hypothetical protein